MLRFVFFTKGVKNTIIRVIQYTQFIVISPRGTKGENNDN